VKQEKIKEKKKEKIIRYIKEDCKRNFKEKKLD
jgi:hypothetical protein